MEIKLHNNTSTYTNSELCSFQILLIRLLFERKIVGEIVYMAEEFADLPSHINVELDSEEVQKLLNSHNQELAIDELIEMHEQKQDIEV
ncbi:hypothetical protein TNCV_4838681 [Trichonephila clavipes]|nr:hypothetical protein TNCV_1058521 [Trichonephila clavipes]GFV21037.1 hypothetical protein TNCV_4838681 [Trichonephila clavipes]